MTNAVTHLFDSFRPKHYELELSPNRNSMTFIGRVRIKGFLSEASNAITLHAHGLEVNKAHIDAQNAKSSIKTDSSELIIAVDDTLEAGEHTIEVAFSGTITEQMHGMYPCNFEQDGTQKQIIATQFESHHAREVFPCIDEPAAKATFQLTLTSPSGEAVISNTPIESQQEQNGQLVTTFETTPKMSTYLLAFAYGQLEYKEAKTSSGVTVRTWATAEHVEHTQFALDVAVRTLEFYDKYFDTPYPLKKCDHIALPDFAAGAMENWGCITYRESALLVDDEHTSLSDKQWVALVVAHELAHQWFGNLVTMEWWNDLWLNEGFASWVEYLAVDTLFPEWEMWTQFVTTDFMRGQALDSLANSHPIEVAINDPNDIRNIFDAISYNKGASVIRMLHSYLGAEDFQKGLRAYLKEYAYANATTLNLWNSLASASGKPVKDFMSRWTEQTGFPVVTATVEPQSIRLKQTRYMINPRERSKTQDASAWPVPINSIHTDEVFELRELEEEWQTDSTGNAVKLNVDQAGFFMVDYNKEHTAHLATLVAKDKITPLDRLGVLNDTFQLAKAGFSSATEALIFLKAFSNEDNAAVWDVIASQLGALRRTMGDDEMYNHLKPFAQKLAAKQAERLGWDQRDDDSHFDKLLRPTVLSMASFGEDAAVVKEALRRFDSMKKPGDEHPDIRAAIYGTAVREHNNRETFDKLCAMHQNVNSSHEKQSLAGAITGFKDEALIHEALEMIKSPAVKPQDAVHWLAYSFSNRHAKDITWRWMTDEWPWISEQFGSDIMTISYFPRIAGNAFSSKEMEEKFKTFFSTAPTTGIDRAVRQGLETIEWQTDWRERDHDKVVAFLRNQL